MLLQESNQRQSGVTRSYFYLNQVDYFPLTASTLVFNTPYRTIYHWNLLLF